MESSVRCKGRSRKVNGYALREVKEQGPSTLLGAGTEAEGTEAIMVSSLRFKVDFGHRISRKAQSSSRGGRCVEGEDSWFSSFVEEYRNKEMY